MELNLDSEAMPPHSPPSPDPHPSKRQRASSPDKDSPSSGNGGPTSPTEHLHDGVGQSSKTGQSSSFRNVSACNRCRLRKNRCDQKLPSCASCEKARVACVGYDPITKREIPRRLVPCLSSVLRLVELILPLAMYTTWKRASTN